MLGLLTYPFLLDPALSLRLQAYVALATSFLRIFFVNLNAAGAPGEVSPRFYTVVPITLAFFYAYWRLELSRDESAAGERRFRAGELCCWLGTITIASLMRFELEADWVAAAWAALAFALDVLADGGGFVAKVFQGGAEMTMLELLKRRFASVRHAKPPASRKETIPPKSRICALASSWPG